MSGQIKLKAASLGGDITLTPTDTASNLVVTIPATAGNMVVSSTDLAFSPYTGMRNRIINGGMTIDQRNAGAAVTLTPSGIYTVDRFVGFEVTDGAMTAQQDSDAPAGFVKSAKLTTTTADATLATNQFALYRQNIEGLNISDLGWGTASAATVTLSFWVRSSLTGTFGGALANSDGNRSYPFVYTISSANTWEKKSITIAGDTSGTWLTTNGIGIRASWGLGVGSDYSGTAGSWASANYFSATSAVSVIGTLNATWYITGVQLEKGSTATPFEFRSIGDELALCQRYLYVLPSGSHTSGYNISTTQTYVPVVLPVTPRTAPTGISTTLSGNLFISSSGYALTNLEYVASSTQTVLLRATTAQTMTTNNGNMLELGNKVLFTGCEL